jgi:hypothetical protein
MIVDAGNNEAAAADLAATIQYHKRTLDAASDIPNPIPLEQIPLGAIASARNFQELGATLAVMPASHESFKKGAYADQINAGFTDLIKTMSGQMEAGTFGDAMMEGLRLNREVMKNKENEMWEPFKEALAAKQRANPGLRVNVRSLTEELQKKKAAGVTTGLSKVEQDVLNGLTINKETGKRGLPTFQDINNLMEPIGNSIGSFSKGQYADQNQGRLKHLYGELSKAKINFAEFQLGADNLRDLNAMTVKRKDLEDQIYFFEKQEPTARMDQVVTALGKGKGKAYDDVIANVPPEHRKAYVATLFNRITDIKSVDAPVVGNGANSRKFADTWGKIMAEPGLKERFVRDLGEENVKMVDNFATLYGSLSRASSGRPTGIAKDAIDNFYEENGIAGKLVSALRTTPGVPQKVTGIIGRMILPEDKSAIKSVNEVLSSATVARAVRAAMEDPASAEAARLSALSMQTGAARKFLAAANQDTRKQIFAAGGIPAWLMLTDDKNKPAEAQ